MIPIHDLLSRIRWDREFSQGRFEIAYFDRHETDLHRVALHEVLFPDDVRHTFEVVDESGQNRRIPFHRVREVVKDGHVIWRRPSSSGRVAATPAALTAALLLGCSGQLATTPVPTADRTTALDEVAVIAIARRAVSTNDTWAATATFEVRADGTGWAVTAWREPRVPGGHRLIRIDQNGHVTAYLRGR